MKQKIFKGSPLVALSLFALLLGAVSCTKVEMGSQEVVSSADFSMGIGGGSVATRASISGNSLYWTAGDKIVMASNGQINGVLTCTEVDGTGKATFSGRIENFTPSGVNLFFFGNREVSGMNPGFDFSLQQGVMSAAASYVFLKSLGVELIAGSDNTYAPALDVTFEGVTSLLTLTLNPAGSPADEGAIATSAQITGMKNYLNVNLADGSVTASYAKALDGSDIEVTSVSPRYVGELSNSYVIGVIPQDAAGLTMAVNYLGTDASTIRTFWSNINWDMSAMAGKTIATTWTGEGKAPVIVETSSKIGYSGVAVEGGENADGQNHKGGYNGTTVGDQVDNPQGDKSGYSGKEVI